MQIYIEAISLVETKLSMEYRTLGKTGLKVCPIGLGTEHLVEVPRETVTSVVHEALDRGVNYIDLFLSLPDYRDNFGAALKERREEAIIAGHLGSAERDGHYFRTRDLHLSEHFFYDLLTRLHTDYIDVLMVHYVDEEDDFEQIISAGGLLNLALRLKEEGKVRFIGMSGHKVPVAMKAVKSGMIDVLMFPINPAFDVLSGTLQIETFWDVAATLDPAILAKQTAFDRKELYHVCARYGVGLVAMKPYANAWLFAPPNSSSLPLTPVHCLSYVLSQPGVSTTVPGLKNLEELRAALHFLDANEEERDYSSILARSRWNLQGTCMYCSHCLPCPALIDVGQVIRLIDTARHGDSEELRASYNALTAHASDCTECGECMDRCPFGVDVIAKMRQGVAFFE